MKVVKPWSDAVVHEIPDADKFNQVPTEIKAEDLNTGTKYTWGTRILSDTFAPIKRGCYTVIGGETGDGKTTFAYFQAVKNANLGHKVLYISLEMDTKEIFDNISRSYAGITIQEEHTSTIPDHKLKLYNDKIKELQGNENLKTSGVRKGSDVTMDDIKQIIKDSGDVDLVYLDNLDLIQVPGAQNDLMRQREVSRQIMNLTTVLDIPITLLHHYRKKSSAGSSKRVIDDLGGTAKVTHDADRVVLLSRSSEKEPTEKDLAELNLFLVKARGYSKSFGKVYFQKGSFVDVYPNQTQVDDAKEVWWNK